MAKGAAKKSPGKTAKPAAAAKKRDPGPGRWIIFDTETTGLLKPLEAPLADQPRIIELAIVETDGKEILREGAWLFDPGCELSAEITKITGLKTEDVRGQPTFSERIEMLIEEWFLGARGIVAHNLPFDHGMLLTELRHIGREHRFPWPPKQVDTVEEFFHLRGRRLRLVELYEISTGNPLAQTHRALDDTRALAEIVLKEGVIG